MSSKDKILAGIKMLSLTYGSGKKIDFIDEKEREIESSKLHYYVWLSRFFIFLAVVSLSAFLSFSLMLFKLAPKVSVEPFLIISQDSSDGIVRYDPISYNVLLENQASMNQMMETFIKQYVIIRNTIVNDQIEMRTRWYPGGMVNFLSAPDVFSQFDSTRKSTWQAMFDAKLVREVEIISAGRVGGEKSAIWKVDFKTYDLSEAARNQRTKALVLKTRYWTASITAYFIPERSFVGLRLINPLGFTVVRYSQTEVELR